MRRCRPPQAPGPRSWPILRELADLDGGRARRRALRHPFRAPSRRRLALHAVGVRASADRTGGWREPRTLTRPIPNVVPSRSRGENLLLPINYLANRLLKMGQNLSRRTWRWSMPSETLRGDVEVEKDRSVNAAILSSACSQTAKTPAFTGVQGSTLRACRERGAK